MYNKINNRGFTLVELLATIAILAVIAVISFVSINGVIEQSKVNDCKNLESTIKSAAKEYVSDKRYDSAFVSKVQSMKVRIKGSDLITNKNLSGNIVNPFNNSESVDADYIVIEIELKDNYTAKEVDVYRDKNEDNILQDEEKFDCSNDWWQ